MIELGTKVMGGDIGYSPNCKSGYIWTACGNCGVERWVQMRKGKASSKNCMKCSKVDQQGPLNPLWKGGTRLDPRGYILTWVPKDDFFALMRCKTSIYVAEHRLVVAKHLGRCLQPSEVVHHKNGNKGDNRLENLELTSNRNHIMQHNKGYEDGYERGYRDGRKAWLKSLESN